MDKPVLYASNRTQIYRRARGVSTSHIKDGKGKNVVVCAVGNRKPSDAYTESQLATPLGIEGSNEMRLEQEYVEDVTTLK